MTPKASPEHYHKRSHAAGPFEGCWRCQRDRAHCKSKRRYETWAEAEAAVSEINLREAFGRPVTRYVCRWCEAWHLATAVGRVPVKRAERARRRWLAEAAISTGGGDHATALEA